MNILYKKIIVAFTIFFYILTSLNATVYPIALNHRIGGSTQIATGKIVQQYSFWDKDKKNIYTANLIEIAAYLKNNSDKQYVELITLGGIVEDEAQIVYPSLDLQLSQNYLFFLEELPNNLLSKSPSKVQRFCAYTHTQGALPLIDNKYKDYTQKESIAPIDLLQRIQEITHFSAIQPNGASYRVEQKSTTTTTAMGRSNIILMNGLEEPASIFYAGTANVNHELVISGSGFGSTPGTVQFANADTGGIGYITSSYESDLVYWTDSKIRVKIPANSGSGSLRILNSAGQVVGDSQIHIDWSITPIFSTYKGFDKKTRQNVSLINYNENGGYTIQINSTSGFLSDTPAVASFEQALTKWQCNTTTNYQLDKTGTTETFANDGICVIQYASDIPLGVLGIATSRYKSAGSTSCTGFNTLWYLKEFDIKFKSHEALESGFSWHFTSDAPMDKQYDFTSIAIHELGHTHGLGHVIEPENIMHYTVPSQTIKRNISSPQIEAVLHRLDFSATHTCITSKEPMTPLIQDCPTEHTSAQISVYLEGNYNEEQGEMTTYLVDENLLPKEQPFAESPYFYTGTESVETFPTDVVDWVLLQIRNKAEQSTILTQKALFVTKNGQLIGMDGNAVITLDDLEQDDYYIAIFHKSHLPIISATPHSFNSEAPLYDFTQSSTAIQGISLSNNTAMMSSGDFDGNGIIDSQDFNLWKQNSSGLKIYSPIDADGNGIITNQDFNLWKANRSKTSFLILGN